MRILIICMLCMFACFNSIAQKAVRYANTRDTISKSNATTVYNTSVDSSQQISSGLKNDIRLSGHYLRNYARAMGFGTALVIAGSVLTLLTMNDPQNQSITFVGAALSAVGSLIILVAPHSIGNAGRVLEEVQDDQSPIYQK